MSLCGIHDGLGIVLQAVAPTAIDGQCRWRRFRGFDRWSAKAKLCASAGDNLEAAGVLAERKDGYVEAFGLIVAFAAMACAEVSAFARVEGTSRFAGGRGADPFCRRARRCCGSQ